MLINIFYVTGICFYSSIVPADGGMTFIRKPLRSDDFAAETMQLIKQFKEKNTNGS